MVSQPTTWDNDHRDFHRVTIDISIVVSPLLWDRYLRSLRLPPRYTGCIFVCSGFPHLYLNSGLVTEFRLPYGHVPSQYYSNPFSEALVVGSLHTAVRAAPISTA